jgi:hypothetical protein
MRGLSMWDLKKGSAEIAVINGKTLPITDKKSKLIGNDILNFTK